jgi:tagatose-1,6-bisphosphate aldolase non-catalytic subunit AgaZ/GatZ
VEQRDFFGAPNRAEARSWLDRCEQLLEQFEATVFEVNATDVDTPSAALTLVDDEASA